MNVGVLGVGRMGARHARLLRDIAGVTGVVVADADSGRASAVADEIGASVSGTADLLERVDAVVIAAGPAHHPAAVRAAVARGVPALCEKPLAADLRETIAVAQEVERSGVPVQIGFQRRFDPAYAEARRMLEAGELGDVFLVRLAALDPPYPPYPAGLRTPTEPVEDGRGAGSDTASLFRDSSIHDFDLARWLTGSEVVEVHAVGAIRGGGVARDRDPDVAAVTMRTASGAICALTGMLLNARGYDIRTEMFGTRDSVVVGHGRRTPLRDLEPGGAPPAADAWTDYRDRFADAYRRELEAFVAIARAGGAPGVGVSDALEAMRVATAATRSLREDRAVRLDEVPGAPAAAGAAR